MVAVIVDQRNPRFADELIMMDLAAPSDALELRQRALHGLDLDAELEADRNCRQCVLHIVLAG